MRGARGPRSTVRLSRVSVVPGEFGGNNLLVKMVTLFDSNGRYVKHVKITEKLAEILAERYLVVFDEEAEELVK